MNDNNNNQNGQSTHRPGLGNISSTVGYSSGTNSAQGRIGEPKESINSKCRENKQSGSSDHTYGLGNITSTVGYSSGTKAAQGQTTNRND